MNVSRAYRIAGWGLRALVAAILFQTLSSSSREQRLVILIVHRAEVPIVSPSLFARIEPPR